MLGWAEEAEDMSPVFSAPVKAAWAESKIRKNLVIEIWDHWDFKTTCILFCFPG